MRRAAEQLSRRERQIMDILFELGEATAKEIHARLPDPPSYSAARAMLAKLEVKGQVRHTERGLRYIYRPTVSRRRAQTSAIRRLVRVFFGGSLTEAVTGMVDLSGRELSDEELEGLAAKIESLRRERSGE